MLNQGMISGQQICELLYEQGVLEKDADYDNLVNNVTDAYAFIYNKIKNLEITPDMLALDPCSGSLAVSYTHLDPPDVIRGADWRADSFCKIH